jgi:hypothetical protein
MLQRIFRIILREGLSKLELFVTGPMQVVGKDGPAMFVVMTVHTEVLPVAAVGRVVMVIAVAVVNGEKLKIVLFELPAALGADPAMQFQ